MQPTRILLGVLAAGIALAVSSAAEGPVAPSQISTPAQPAPTVPANPSANQPVPVAQPEAAPASPGSTLAAPGQQLRQISLEDAIQTALEHNLDIQIELKNPEIFQYTLNEAYSVYEPALTFSYSHDFNSSPGGINVEGLKRPSTEIDSDSFASSLGPGLSGYLPGTGLRYQLNGNTSRSKFDPPGTEQYNAGAGISLRQPLLRDFWTDQPRTTIALNKRNVKIADWAFRQQVLTTVNNVEQAYYNLIFARENIRVQEKALELADRLLVENSKRVEVGQMAPLEEQQAKSQAATSRAALVEARRAYEAQENILKGLLTDDYAKLHGVRLEPTENLLSIPPSYDLAESWRKAFALRPDLQQLRLDLEKRDITLKFDFNQLFPALDLVGSYGRNGLNVSYGTALDDIANETNPRYSYGVVLSVPLGNISARNRYKVGKAEKKQALLRYKKLEDDILIQVDDSVKQVQASYERIQATHEARLFAEAALQAEQKKLESGKSTSFNVLQLQRDLTAARFEEIRALAEYNNALAQLAFREGSTLDRHHINVNTH